MFSMFQFKSLENISFPLKNKILRERHTQTLQRKNLPGIIPERSVILYYFNPHILL